MSYARPLFHQQWDLFAPDVPPCGCTIEVKTEDGYVDLMEGRGLIGRRLVKWGCRLMPNYRDPNPSDGDFQAWVGFNHFVDVLDGSEEELPARVKRTCFGGSERVVHYDVIK